MTDDAGLLATRSEPVDLTDDEREALFRRPREFSVRRDTDALEVIVARIKADAYAAGLAARPEPVDQ
jgi:hypothetical protein